MVTSFVTPEFRWTNDNDQCCRCRRCIKQCGWGALSWENRVVADQNKCVGCHRCETFCPEHCITILPNPTFYRPNCNWSVKHRKNVYRQAETGGVLLTGMGADWDFPVLFDQLFLDACQVTNPSIDPLREPMELRTYLGRKPERVEVAVDSSGKVSLQTEIGAELHAGDAHHLLADVLRLDFSQRAKEPGHGRRRLRHPVEHRGRRACTRT